MEFTLAHKEGVVKLFFRADLLFIEVTQPLQKNETILIFLYLREAV